MLQFQVFKILSYEEVDPTNTERVERLLEEGNMMVGHFPLSRNYFSLKPGQVYVFDKEKPYSAPQVGDGGVPRRDDDRRRASADCRLRPTGTPHGAAEQRGPAVRDQRHRQGLQEGRRRPVTDKGREREAQAGAGSLPLTQAAEWLASDNVQVVTDVDHHHEEPMQRETMHYLISSDEVIVRRCCAQPCGCVYLFFVRELEA